MTSLLKNCWWNHTFRKVTGFGDIADKKADELFKKTHDHEETAKKQFGDALKKAFHIQQKLTKIACSGSHVTSILAFCHAGCRKVNGSVFAGTVFLGDREQHVDHLAG